MKTRKVRSLTLTIALSIFLGGCLDTSEGIFIRVQNEGTALAEDLILAGENFGNLDPTESSNYIQVLQAFTSPNYSLVVNGQTIDVSFIVPGDPLSDGFFTYRLSFDLDGQGEVIELDMQVAQD